MAENKIEFEISARIDDVEKRLKQVEEAAAKSGKKIESSFNSALDDKIKGSFKSLATTAIAAGAALAAAFGTKAIVAAAIEQENAINQLNQSLISAGSFSNAASQQIQDFADSIQRLTTVDGEAVLQGVALARNFTQTNEAAQKLTKTAVDLAAATGVSLDTAVEQLGKTLQGSAGRLAQQIPGLKNFTAEQLKAGAAIDLVAQRFDGFAEGQAKTFGGALLQLQNNFQDLQAEFGKAITQSPAIIAAIGEISKIIGEFTDSLKEAGDENNDPFKKLVQSALTFGNIVVQVVGRSGEVIFNFLSRVGEGIGLVGAIISEAIAGNFAGVTELLKTPIDFSDVLMTPNTDAVVAAFDRVSAAVDASTASVKKLGDQIPPTQEKIKELVVNVNFDDFVSAFEQTQQQVDQIAKQMVQSLKTTFVNGVGGAFQAVGAALVKGKNVFAAFGKAILGMFGDIAIQLGQFYLTLGFANLFLNPAAAAGQLAGGAALLALGGALKALAGGEGGGASSPAKAGGGGAGAAPVGDSQFNAAETQKQEPQTNIAVNIEGNVLGDKRTLGKEVAGAINEAFGSNGIVIAKGVTA